MGQAASIRGTVRNLITTLGSDASLYSFSSATKTQNEEGDYTVSSWGSATSIKVVSSNHYQLKRMMEMMGQETDNSDRVFLIRDDVTIAAKDKIVVGTDTYEVTEIKKIDPIENTNIAYRIMVSPNETY